MNGVEWQDAFNMVVVVATAMGGWIMGRISKTLDRLDEDMRALPEKYVIKEDYRSDIHDIKNSLIRVEEKLGTKADR